MRSLGSWCSTAYAVRMKRVTVSLDESLVGAVQADVAAGRAVSVSAWVSDAVRRKALARVELLADLEDAEAADPYTDDDIAWVAEAVGRDRSWVEARLRGDR